MAISIIAAKRGARRALWVPIEGPPRGGSLLDRPTDRGRENYGISRRWCSSPIAGWSKAIPQVGELTLDVYHTPATRRACRVPSPPSKLALVGDVLFQG